MRYQKRSGYKQLRCIWLILLVQIFWILPESAMAYENIMFYRDSKVNYIDLDSTKCSYMIDDTYTWSVSQVGAILKVRALGLSKRGALLIVFCPGRDDTLYNLSYSNTLKFDDLYSNGNQIANRDTFAGAILNSSPVRHGLDLLINDRSYDPLQLFLRGGKGQQLLINDWTETNNTSVQMINKFKHITLNLGYYNNKYLTREKDSYSVGLVFSRFNLTYQKRDFTTVSDLGERITTTDHEILASVNYMVSVSLRLIKSENSDFAQISIPLNRGLGDFGSLNFTYRHEYMKSNNVISMSNMFQFYHIFRSGAERQIFTRLDAFCPNDGKCFANRFDTNWIENFGDWQNDLTISLQPTLINEILTYQFNPMNQVKIGVYKVLNSPQFMEAIIAEDSKSADGPVRGNLMYENRINGKSFSLINSLSQAIYSDREFGDFFQYTATLNYVYDSFEVLFNATIRPITKIEESRYNLTLTVNYFPDFNLKKLTDKFDDHSLIFEYKSATTGQAIANVNVEVEMNGLTYKAKTNKQGFVQIKNIPQEGDMKVTARGFSYGSKFKSELEFTKSRSVPTLKELIYVKDSVTIPVKIYLDEDRSGSVSNRDDLVNIKLTDTLTGEKLITCGDAPLTKYGFVVSLNYTCSLVVNEIMLPSRYQVIKLIPTYLDASRTKMVRLLLRRYR